MTVSRPAHQRILLKLSGEALMGDDAFGINRATIVRMVDEVAEVTRLGVQVAVVIGGGNIFRGLSGVPAGIERASADHMGMLATVINGMALQAMLEKVGVFTRLQSAIKMEQIAEPYIRRRAIRHLEKKRIVLFAAGTGNPYFTTDSAATLRAIETGCDILLKATNVDGVYDKDPNKSKDAKRYEHLTYTEAINRQLKVMDTSAIALCRENNMPIRVFNLNVPGNLVRAATGENIGTLVTGE